MLSPKHSDIKNTDQCIQDYSHKLGKEMVFQLR